jgi:hypothetical protein
LYGRELEELNQIRVRHVVDILYPLGETGMDDNVAGDDDCCSAKGTKPKNNTHVALHKVIQVIYLENFTKFNTVMYFLENVRFRVHVVDCESIRE